MGKHRSPDSTNVPPFETDDLRKNLSRFLDSKYSVSDNTGVGKVGDYRWGVYAFFDYDGEPIYVGQTNEKLRTRIRRHLTNQRTDAVAMSVLDPFEVYEIEVWPLPQFQSVGSKDKSAPLYRKAKAHLDSLENQIYQSAIAKSQFNAVLNEKNPPPTNSKVPVPTSHRDRVVSDKVHEIRAHPDFRLARRALVIARLAQVISERKVQGGLRRVLQTQAQRLQWLADRRYKALGGPALVEFEKDDDSDEEA